MPCKCDYMEPNRRERESANVISLLKELGIVVEGQGIYGNISKLDENTDMLCKACQAIDVSDYSLELQMWWRDHQKADEARIEKELQAVEDFKDRETALAKLTPRERRLLGL